MYCYSMNITYPMLINKKISSSIEYERVQMFRIKDQGVVIIKPINFNVWQAHFIVWKNSIWIQHVTHNWRNQLCEQGRGKKVIPALWVYLNKDTEIH